MPIRNYNVTDYVRVCDLHYQLIQEHKANSNMAFKYSLNKDFYCKDLQKYLSKQLAVKLVATKNGEVVGYCIVDLSDDDKTLKIPNIRFLYVEPAYRGKGIATDLIQVGIEQSKAILGGNFGCTISVETWNTAALTLYKKLGFEPISLQLYKR